MQLWNSSNSLSLHSRRECIYTGWRWEGPTAWHTLTSLSPNSKPVHTSSQMLHPIRYEKKTKPKFLDKIRLGKAGNCQAGKFFIGILHYADIDRADLHLSAFVHVRTEECLFMDMSTEITVYLEILRRMPNGLHLVKCLHVEAIKWNLMWKSKLNFLIMKSCLCVSFWYNWSKM